MSDVEKVLAEFATEPDGYVAAYFDSATGMTRYETNAPGPLDERRIAAEVVSLREQLAAATARAGELREAVVSVCEHMEGQGEGGRWPVRHLRRTLDGTMADEDEDMGISEAFGYDADAESDPEVVVLDAMCAWCGAAHHQPAEQRGCRCKRHIDGGQGNDGCGAFSRIIVEAPRG